MTHQTRSPVDVVVIGEVLVELRTTQPLRTATTFRSAFSGDALNAAAAAAAAGAHTALLTIIGDDEIGDALLQRAAELQIDTSWVHRTGRPNGLYMATADLSDHREFAYWRTGSAASTLSVEVVNTWLRPLTSAGGLLISGITAALSDGARKATLHALQVAHHAGAYVTYDPNFRAALTTPEDARTILADASPFATLITPSCPGDTGPLLDTTNPRAAAAIIQRLNADAAVAVTSGPEDVTLMAPGIKISLPTPTNPAPIDATGAGDVLAGTCTARRVLGDELPHALRLGIAAASLSVSGHGGTGYIPNLSETRTVAMGLDSPS